MWLLTYRWHVCKSRRLNENIYGTYMELVTYMWHVCKLCKDWWEHIYDVISIVFNPFAPGDFARKTRFEASRVVFWSLSCYKELKLTTNRFTGRTLRGLLIQMQNISLRSSCMHRNKVTQQSWLYTLNVRSRGKQLVLFSRESWCFPRQSRGKHQDSRESKINWFPEGPDIKCLLHNISRLSLQQQQENNRSEPKQSTRYL